MSYTTRLDPKLTLFCMCRFMIFKHIHRFMTQNFPNPFVYFLCSHGFLPLVAPGKHWSDLQHWSVVFLRMSYKYKQTVCNLSDSFFFTQHNAFEVDTLFFAYINYSFLLLYLVFNFKVIIDSQEVIKKKKQHRRSHISFIRFP